MPTPRNAPRNWPARPAPPPTPAPPTCGKCRRPWARSRDRVTVSRRSSGTSTRSPSRRISWPSTRRWKPPAPGKRAWVSPSSRMKSATLPSAAPRPPRRRRPRSRTPLARASAAWKSAPGWRRTSTTSLARRARWTNTWPRSPARPPSRARASARSTRR